MQHYRKNRTKADPSELPDAKPPKRNLMPQGRNAGRVMWEWLSKWGEHPLRIKVLGERGGELREWGPGRRAIFGM